ncbi:probable G-protein coupled receptor 63 [Tachysurus vachellii]|uniref:probable G-protein coupled receptor 63 n=1 Tax=Tachysurus vachellii TaxID=175792 RepID=UPI00296AFFC1|nr:probable G-protein coupled receptor 63 [Tachysurus vachellii]XP_060739403.1 probable G-protein coupled receptor 63 [Tachysurus vachellii]XP_060739404.1 probable G-protein coupled receptor 63 [Tachysurus vachellii]
MLFALANNTNTLPRPSTAISQSDFMENSSSFSWGEDSSSLVLRTLWATPTAQVTEHAVVQEVGQDVGGHVLSMPLQVFFSVVMVCVLLLALCGNAVVCVMVYRRAAMRSAINCLLANLAFADMMLAVTAMPFDLVTMVTTQWLFSATFCRASAMFLWLCMSVGVAMLLAISMDRFLIIVRRQDRLTPHRAKILIATSWILAFFLAFPLLLGYPSLQVPPSALHCVLSYSPDSSYHGYMVILALLTFFMPFAVMSCAFGTILSSIRHNALRIHCNSALSLSKPRSLHLSVDVGFKTRAFFTILLLFMLAFASLAPLVVFSLCAAFSDAVYSGAGFFQVSAWLLILSFLRPALNPLIYYCRIRKFRHAFSRWVPSLCRLCPPLLSHAQRRIQPSAVYSCSDHRSSI